MTTYILIVLAAFHFDGGMESQQIEFKTLEKCEKARAAILSEFSKKADGWGRQRIVVVCSPK